MSVESVITEKLNIWTSAKKTKSASGRGTSNKLELYGIKKLRELIFELAIRGKLIAAEVTDTPVDNLIANIEEEKARLVKSKALKKPKKFPAIKSGDTPFDIPAGWQWVRLGSIGNIFNGNSVNAKLKEEKYTGLAQGLPFIATKDVSYGFDQLDYDNGVLIPNGEPKFKVAKPGAVLVCAEGGSAGKKCGITNKDICFGNKLFANQLYGNISPKYILSYYLSPTFYKMFSESVTGIIGGISATKFSELLIPLPPLSYQHRLVSKIDELMQLCDQLESQTELNIEAHKTLVEALLATLTNAKGADELFESWQRISEYFDTLFTSKDSIDLLKQTILQLAVMGKLVKQDSNDEPASALLKRIAEEKEQLIKEKEIKKPKATEAILDEEVEFELPGKWSLVKCQDVCLKITDGEHSTPRRTETGHYLLSARNVTNEGIQLNDVDYVPTSEFERIRKRCDPNIGDILISCSGSVGRVAIVDADSKYSMVRSAAMIRPEPSLSVDYLALLLRSPYLQRQIKKRSKQSAQANLFLGAISNLTFAIPPKNEQIKIAEKVDELLTICNLLKFQLSEAQATQNNLADSISSSLVN